MKRLYFLTLLAKNVWAVVLAKIGYGFWCTLKGLVAMMLGGIGSLPGAIIGGLFLGLVESNVINYLGAEYRDICTYLILLFILVVKPGGIMGSALLRDERDASERI